MESFKDQISEKGFGMLLRQRRLDLDLNIDQISRATRLSQQYIRAIEEESLDKMPEFVYAKHFIISYGDFLGFHVDDPLIQDYLAYVQSSKAVRSRQRDSRRDWISSYYHRFDITRLIRRMFWVGLVVMLLGYISLEVKQLFAPPYLEILHPEDNQHFASAEVEIVGKTDQKASVFINGVEIFEDEQGRFHTLVRLPSGMNTLEVISKKKHGGSTRLLRTIFVSGGQQASL